MNLIKQSISDKPNPRSYKLTITVLLSIGVLAVIILGFKQEGDKTEPGKLSASFFQSDLTTISKLKPESVERDAKPLNELISDLDQLDLLQLSQPLLEPGSVAEFRETALTEDKLEQIRDLRKEIETMQLPNVATLPPDVLLALDGQLGEDSNSMESLIEVFEVSDVSSFVLPHEQEISFTTDGYSPLQAQVYTDIYMGTGIDQSEIDQLFNQ